MSSPLDALGDVAGALVALSRTRLELLGEELRVERSRLLCLLAALFAAAAFLLLALLVASVAFTLYVWPGEQRYLALAVLALVYALLGAAAALWLMMRLHRDPPVLRATLGVLGDDLEALRRSRSRATAASTPGAADGSLPVQPTQEDVE